MCDQQSFRSACAYAQSDQSICDSLEYSMIVKLLTGHHLEFLSLKVGCRGSSEYTHAKMPQCWKAHALAHIIPNSIIFCSCCSELYKLTNVLNNHYSIIGLRKWFLYQFKILVFLKLLYIIDSCFRLALNISLIYSEEW